MVRAVKVAESQLQSQWCWAACIATVFAHHGYPVAQQRIVTDAYGSPKNFPAQPWTILDKLNQGWKDESGRPFVAAATGVPYGPPEMARELEAGNPLIIGYSSGNSGHAVVLTALTYAMPWVQTPLGRQLGRAIIQSVTVRDPWPGKGKRLLEPREWQSIHFATKIRVMRIM